jgi:hypothetical protein
MRNWDPVTFIWLGFLLLVIGVALPMLMVMQILESTFFLNFFSYACSFVGLMFGLIGTAWYTRKHRRK